MKFSLKTLVVSISIMLLIPTKSFSAYPIQIFSSNESVLANGDPNFVYLTFEYTKGVDFWKTNSIISVTCSNSLGTPCLDKGTYTKTDAPASRFGDIRLEDALGRPAFSVILNIVTAPIADPTNISTESLTYYYRYNSPITDHDLKPLLISSSEFVSGGTAYLTFKSQRTFVEDTHVYPSAHSCFSPQISCWINTTFNTDGTYTIETQWQNYSQGSTFTLYINRHWVGQNYATETSTNPPEATLVSSYTFSTLQQGIFPTISNLRSEIYGCSFNIDNYDSNFTYYFKRLDSDISINANGYVRIIGQKDGEIREDYPSSRRTGFTTENNISALFNCISLTRDERVAIEKANAEAAERAAAEEAARQAEIRRQNAINEIINLKANSNLSISTLREAGIHFAINETVESLTGFILTLDSNSRRDVQRINDEANRLRQEYFFTLLESDISLKNLQNLDFVNVSERLVSEVKRVLLQTNFVKSRNRLAIQNEIDKVATLFKGRDSGTLSEGELKLLDIEIKLQSKKSEVLLRFKNQEPLVFLNSESITFRIREIENLIQERLNRTIDAKKRTQEIRERIDKRKVKTNNPSEN